MDDFTALSAEAATAEIEMLRSEIEQLQYELAERDAQLTTAASCTPQAEQVDDATTSHLVDRLEQLLDELERSDGRIGALEELLQAAEETSRAEQEERRQLEAWVTDIETRIAEREEDWNAESETLRHRLQEVGQERDQLLRQSQETPATSAGTDLDHAQLEQLRAENAQLRNQLTRQPDEAPAVTEGPEVDHTQLEHLRGENSQLQQSLDEALAEQERMAEQIRQQRDLLARAAEVDSETREERLRLAQERASLTRQQAELAALKSEVEDQPMRPESEIDGRVRAFRQHLREIHEQEKDQRTEQTLSSRVSRIWRRLEKRP